MLLLWYIGTPFFYGNYSLPSSFNTKHLASFLSQGNKEVVVKYEHQPFGIQSL